MIIQQQIKKKLFIEFSLTDLSVKSNVAVERRRNERKDTKLFYNFAMDIIRKFL